MWMVAVRVTYDRWQDLIGIDDNGVEHKLGRAEAWDYIDADTWVGNALKEIAQCSRI